MAPAVYLLCALTSIGCALLLFRQYRQTRGRLLFWSVLCFLCLALTNVLLFVDLAVVSSVDMSILRHSLTLSGMVMLLYGTIRETT